MRLWACGDENARAYFYGDDCELRRDADGKPELFYKLPGGGGEHPCHLLGGDPLQDLAPGLLRGLLQRLVELLHQESPGGWVPGQTHGPSCERIPGLDHRLVLRGPEDRDHGTA